MSNFLKHINPLIRTKKVGDNDPNYAFLNAIDSILKDYEEDTVSSGRHSFLLTAGGEYLDEFGSWFGVRRNAGESDSSYRGRMVAYVDTPRGSIGAIELAVKRFFEDPDMEVEIYETYRNIFMLNSSLLNGPDKLQGDHYRFAVIEIRLVEELDSATASDLIAFVERYIPAGVSVHVAVIQEDE